MNRFIILLIAQAAAQAPGEGISKSTYACNDPIAAKNFLYKYFPVAAPGDECDNDVCKCSASGSTPAWEIQQGRVYVKKSSGAGEGRRLQSPGNGFGLHCVNVSNHLTTGGLSTAEVEAYFNTKMGDMTAFDSFMDFSVTFYTSGLQQYAAAFDADKVPYYTTTSQADNAQTYTSLIVQVPNTQMILELTSKKSLALTETQRAVNVAAPKERRISARAVAMIEELEQANMLTGASLTPLSVNRAVSAAVLAKLDDFYVTGMGTKKVSTDNDSANGYTRQCYLWTGSTVDICFVNRDDSTTKGDWKVADFENMLNTVHKNIIVGYPLCGTDKWADNHYAIDSMTADTSTVVSYINKNNVPYTCESGGSGGTSLHYAFDPTGWGIQLDLSFSSQPSGCSTAAQSQDSLRRLQGLKGTFNPACDAGTCGGSPSPGPTPPGPSPGPTPPGPSPGPPSPSAHCDQCKTLVQNKCGDAGSSDKCQSCASSHADKWAGEGCEVTSCGEKVDAACGGSPSPGPTPPGPSPGPTPPGPSPGPPSPSAHCDQCKTLVHKKCGDAGSKKKCQSCASSNADKWGGEGCEVTSCGEKVEAACAPSAEVFV